MRSAPPLQAGTTASESPTRRVVGVVLLITGAVLAAASLLGFAGEVWWVFDLFAHPRLQYAPALVLVGAGLVATGSTRAAAVALAIATLNAMVVAPLFIPAPAAASDGPSLTVVSFNVQVGNPDRPAVIEWVRSLDADVVFLWETSGPWREEFAAADLPFLIFEPLQDGTTIGGLVLTSGPADVALLDTGDRSSIEVTVSFAGEQMVVIGAHPYPPISRRYAAERDRQLEAVAAHATAVDGPVVVAGDLNATPWSSALRPLLATLANSMDGKGWVATYPSGLGPLMLPIDHVLHNDAFVTVERRLGPDLGSDHLPVIVTLGTPAAGKDG